MHHSYDDTGADDDFSRPSKSQLKRDMHDLQSLGEDLPVSYTHLTLPTN